MTYGDLEELRGRLVERFEVFNTTAQDWELEQAFMYLAETLDIVTEYVFKDEDED